MGGTQEQADGTTNARAVLPTHFFGVGIMRERAEAVRAQVGIGSKPGRGTDVRCVVCPRRGVNRLMGRESER